MILLCPYSVLHGLLKEPIISPLKFKMVNGRHIENRVVFYGFPIAFCASTSGGFRMVSDTLVKLTFVLCACNSHNGLMAHSHWRQLLERIVRVSVNWC